MLVPKLGRIFPLSLFSLGCYSCEKLKKIMSDLEKTYDPKTVDSKWYKFWEEKKFFHAEVSSTKEPYSIVIPPPNVTGVLHMGHALVNTLQDIQIRLARMLGYEALWVPGTDHAGIATQTVVERHLIKTQGKRRKEFPREEFLGHVWDWKEQNESRIINQLKMLGCSCDWERLRFTMDEGNNSAVRTIFKKMFDAGVIYRGDYLVNWDPITQTALGDDEVEYEEREGFLWHFKYPLEDGSGHVHIATTRPETMLGDTAVAVSPDDKRYADLVGKNVILPFVNRTIPIIADRYVDPQFGTGMVKITPAHDPNDNQIGMRHDLPFVNIMTPDGKINENGAEFEGMTMESAREAIVKAMKEKGLFEKMEPHIHRVGTSYRSHAVIEPYMSKQWFVKMDTFKGKMKDAIESGKIELTPPHWKSTYDHWIENLRDWCISRQLWWGHRIPIWYRKDDPDTIICFDGEGLPPEVAANPNQWEQDEDVLDTWFSSALWPFAALGWPEKTPELEKFYPNSLMVTGYDILFFWVARMICMGEYVMDELPFPKVFLNGLIFGKSYWTKDEHGAVHYLPEKERVEYDLGKPIPKGVESKWEKLSKSKGNIIDPLEMIDQYGTDAVRMALCASGPQSREIDLDRRRFEEFKNFANKVWNGARFVFMNICDQKVLLEGLQEEILQLEDHWILSMVNRTIRDVNGHLEKFNFDHAAQLSYDFFWKEFCSYYLEISKPVLFGKSGTEEERKNKQRILAIVLSLSIRLLHPMAPFITEELFQQLKKHFGDLPTVDTVDPYTKEAIAALQAEACIVSHYPQVIREKDINLEINETFDLIEQVVYTLRNIRGELKIPPSTATDVHIAGEELDVCQKNEKMIRALIRINELEFHSSRPELPHASVGLVKGLSIIVPIPQELLVQEKQRLVKEEERLINSVERIQKQLANENFTSRAPAELIEKQRSQLTQNQSELKEIKEKLVTLK